VRIAYIAGPYGSDDPIQIAQNIQNVRKIAATIVRKAAPRWGFFAPHLNSAHFEHFTPDAPVEYWYELDLEILANMDALILSEGWEGSKGTLAEIEFARRMGTPIYNGVEEFLMHHEGGE
jgi:hypothetical protein